MIDPNVTEFWYLATPYSKYSKGHEAAFKESCVQAGILLNAGIKVFGPIAHSHPIAEYGNIDKLDYEMFLGLDVPFLNAAKGIIVCKLDGWDKSYGVDWEIKHMQTRNKPVVYMEPGVIPDLNCYEAMTVEDWDAYERISAVS